MITSDDFTYTKFNFPCGEMHVRINPIHTDYLAVPTKVHLKFLFEKNEDIIELLLVNSALNECGSRIVSIQIPYIPFSRQDRVATKGDCFSLKVFATLINSIKADYVVVTDPHSDVSTALIENCIVAKQWQVFEPVLRDRKDYWLVSPDAGASKKIYDLAAKVNALGVVECSKRRNVKTGEITGVSTCATDLQSKDCYIVDDICDGGRTFIEVAKVLKSINGGKIVLFVTHGFFTKGLQVFDGLIDEVYTRKGRVK